MDNDKRKIGPAGELIASILELATQQELLDYMEGVFGKMMSTAKAKNSDYTGCDDAFDNFTAGEKLGIGPSEEGFLWRMTDKFKRMITFVKRGALQVKDETVTDTVHDFAVYLVLFSAYLHFKRLRQAIWHTPDKRVLSKMPPEKGNPLTDMIEAGGLSTEKAKELFQELLDSFPLELGEVLKEKESFPSMELEQSVDPDSKVWPALKEELRREVKAKNDELTTNAVVRFLRNQGVSEEKIQEVLEKDPPLPKDTHRMPEAAAAQDPMRVSRGVRLS